MDHIETAEFAKKYIEDILAFFDLNVEVEVKIEDDVVVLSVPHNERNSILIGRGAETLRSFQYLLSTTLRQKNASTSRVNLDIADYKKQHTEKVEERAKSWINEVRQTGESKVLDLNAADRWIVHHVASTFSDIETHSEGEGRDRRLIISQKSS